jgi:hypothetical protein
MTNSEALLAKVGYPLSDNAIHIALEVRELDPADIFVASENIQAFDLAYADALVMIITQPSSFSEGGYSVSAGDRKILAEMANKIFLKYGKASPLESLKPKATFVQRW